VKRIGILGGTFNPIHIGHLLIAEEARSKLKLDKVIFVPANLPPHKTSKSLISSKDRYKMVQLATRSNPNFEVSNYEIKKTGKSYSVDTVNYFHKKFPKKTKLYFIIGGDSYQTLDKWRQIDDILKKVTFVTVNRPGYKGVKHKIKSYQIEMPEVNAASSDLRRRIVLGKSIKYLLPESVIRYIKKRKLYS